MKGNRLLTLAQAAVIVALMSVVDVSTLALAPWLSRAKRAYAGLAWRLAFVRLHFPALYRLGAASLAAAMLLSGAPLVAFGAALTETGKTANFILTELDSDRGAFARDNVVVASGNNLKAGAVVGYVNIAPGKMDIPAVAGTGNGLMSALFAGVDVEKGNYLVKCTGLAANGGTFSVTTPSGRLLPNFVMAAGSGSQAVSYTSSHINFTVTDGATDFAMNDLFTIAVATGSPTVVGTGTGTLTAIALQKDAIPGRYRFECIVAVTNGGTFQVKEPAGYSLGSFIMTAGAGAATAFKSSHLNFTLTDAGTDFVVGDFFEVVVWNELQPTGSRAQGKVVAWDPTTFDGRHLPAGILYADTDATSADTGGVIIARGAEVAQAQLVWLAAVTVAQQYAALKQLAALGIVAR